MNRRRLFTSRSVRWQLLHPFYLESVIQLVVDDGHVDIKLLDTVNRTLTKETLAALV